jgi:hypothetical protein
MAFGTSNTERARISSDGTFRVKGAGTAGSTDAFQVAGTAPASAMTLFASGGFSVGNTTDPGAGAISARSSSNPHIFDSTSGTEVIGITKNAGNAAYLATVGSADSGLQIKDSAGAVNLTVGTSGKSVALQGGTVSTGTGITFPATQSASTNANTLDDYEEGTWAPTDNSGAGLTFTSVYASYIKIGRAVTINVELTFPSTANTSNVAISLPVASDSSTRGGGAIFSNRSPAGTNIYFPGGANFVLYDDAGVQLTNANLTTKYLIFSLTYFTA